MAKRETIFENNIYSISYDIYNSNSQKTILFLHGWGSSREIMKIAFKNSFKNWRHIYIDMSGFGESSEPHRPLSSFDYFTIISLFLAEINIKPDMIFGHSFGGKIATLLNPEHLVLLSSAGILEKKSLKVNIKIFIFKFLKWSGLKSLRNIFVSTDGKNLSENMYGTFKTVVNEDFSYIFKNRENKTTDIFWGVDDQATSLSSGQTISGLIKNANFYQFDGDHYFFLKISHKIENILTEKQ